MIAVDASALVAIVQREPGWEAYALALAESDGSVIGAPTRLETHVVMLRRLGERAALEMDALMQQFSIQIAPLDEAQLVLAREGFTRWGRGRGKANLNFGDCFSYALAKSRNLPLLFRGDDFRGTDIAAVI